MAEPPSQKRRARRDLIVLALIGNLVLIAAVVALLLSGSSGGQGHGAFESLFQDDDHLLYSPTSRVRATIDRLERLGVDRLRLTIDWKAIAPAASSRVRPSFDASNPASYPAAAWGPYDRVVELAHARGIKVDFNVTLPGPLWAMAPGAPDLKTADHYKPSATEFGQFVTAMGKRYSGSYIPSVQAQRASAAFGATVFPLPRVSYWSIVNEPNQPGWLAPQTELVGGQLVPVAPRLYRDLADQAVGALSRTGHGTDSDTVLIGELAPEGSEATGPKAAIAPIPFLRTLYCVDANTRALRGAPAEAVGCPGSPDPGAFASAHPGLFRITGFAHHPYSFFLAPAVQIANRNYVPLANLSRLERALDEIFTLYGVARRLPIYLTEYGYETNPPNPFRGFRPRLQSLFLNEALYIASQDPRVRCLSQFLLYDSQPDRRYRRGTARYWSTFQTGLLYANGRPKPSLNAYRLPIYVPNPIFAPGSSTLVWGMLRPAPNNTTQQAQIQWRPAHGRYRAIERVVTTDPSGFLRTRIRVPGSGAIRIVWVSPSGVAFHSRAVGVASSG